MDEGAHHDVQMPNLDKEIVEHAKCKLYAMLTRTHRVRHGNKAIALEEEHLKRNISACQHRKRK
jgi:hypothetical protein